MVSCKVYETWEKRTFIVYSEVIGPVTVDNLKVRSIGSNSIDALVVWLDMDEL